MNQPDKGLRISNKEQSYVMEVLESQFKSSAGSSMSRRLEEAFAEKLGVKYAVSYINGTATLHSALAAAGIGAGDEVIVPPLTMSSTSFAVLHANAVPVFADIDPHTFTIDPSEIEKCITPNTRAIMPVALYGLSPDMDAIMDIAARHKLVVIEDAAQCLLGYHKGRIVGSIGDMASFSFQSSKHVTSGEGGMVITNDEDLATRVRRFGSLGYIAVGAKPGQGKITKDILQSPDYERHSSVGFNYRMPELCAAVALAQVERMEEFVERRIEVADLFDQVVRGCNWLIPQIVPEGYRHSYWTYVAKLENNNEFSWHDFRNKYLELGGDGIWAAWQLAYLEPALRDMKHYPHTCPLECSLYEGSKQTYEPGLCPVAESAQTKMLQFKTNYMDLNVAEKKVHALAAAISYFDC